MSTKAGVRSQQLATLLCTFAIVSCQTPNVPLPIPMIGIGNEQLTPDEAKVELHRVWTQQQHVAGLAYELGVANVELCGEDTSSELGIEWLTLADFPNANLRIAGSQLGVGRLPFVTVVTPQSPAGRAGMLNGDTILTMNGVAMPTAPETYLGYIEINNVRVPMYRRKVDRILEEATEERRVVPVTVRRDGDHVSLEIELIESCDFRVVVMEEARLRLENQGTSILISNALIDLTHTDEEVQMLLAHQLAHILSKHGTKKTRNAMIGGAAGGAAATAVLLPVAIIGAIAGEDVEFVGDAIEGSARLSSEAGGGMFALRYEREADYLAIYLLERTGIETDDYLSFWDRMPSDEALSTTDTRIEERAANVEASIDEIEEKRVAGLPLVPNEELKPQTDE